MKVQIITDSAADLSKELLSNYHIDSIPLRVYQQEQEYLDGVTLSSKDLFHNMREGAVYKTSLPAYEDTNRIFGEYAKQGVPCIYIAFSSELSGTYQAALLVKDEVIEAYPAFDISIVDTKCASIGQGLIALQAAEMAQQGASKEEIMERIQFLLAHMEHIFTVGDLEYLVRGGRVSRLAGAIGGMLNIKPILHMQEGKLLPLEKLRGRKKLFTRMLDLMEERGENLASQTIGISHGDDIESVNTLKEMITERFGCNTFVVSMIGAAIGAHAGPGTLAVFFLNKHI